MQKDLRTQVLQLVKNPFDKLAGCQQRMAETAFFAPKLYKGTASGVQRRAPAVREAARRSTAEARSRRSEATPCDYASAMGSKTPLICGIYSREMAVYAISTCQ